MLHDAHLRCTGEERFGDSGLSCWYCWSSDCRGWGHVGHSRPWSHVRWDCWMNRTQSTNTFRHLSHIKVSVFGQYKFFGKEAIRKNMLTLITCFLKAITTHPVVYLASLGASSPPLASYCKSRKNTENLRDRLDWELK